MFSAGMCVPCSGVCGFSRPVCPAVASGFLCSVLECVYRVRVCAVLVDRYVPLRRLGGSPAGRAGGKYKSICKLITAMEKGPGLLGLLGPASVCGFIACACVLLMVIAGTDCNSTAFLWVPGGLLLPRASLPLCLTQPCSPDLPL